MNWCPGVTVAQLAPYLTIPYFTMFIFDILWSNYMDYLIMKSNSNPKRILYIRKLSQTVAFLFPALILSLLTYLGSVKHPAHPQYLVCYLKYPYWPCYMSMYRFSRWIEFVCRDCVAECGHGPDGELAQRLLVQHDRPGGSETRWGVMWP